MAASLWLDAVQRLADRATHEIRNPLNGLALNVEVVRSRATRGGADVASIARFADASARELERTIQLVDALLSLARPVGAPLDLWDALRPLVTLHHALASAGEGRGTGKGRGRALDGDGERGEGNGAVVLAPRGGASLQVDADPTVARVALATALDAAASASSPPHVLCSVERRDERHVVLVIRCAKPTSPAPDAVLDLLRGSGIRLEAASGGIIVLFRALGRDPTTTT